MSESSFTPGPWRIEHSLESAYVRADCPACAAKGVKEPIGIAQMFRTGAGDDHVEHEMANARLITAAPELFEALTRLDAFWTECHPAGPDDPSMANGERLSAVTVTIWKAARAALLKASPEQSDV